MHLLGRKSVGLRCTGGEHCEEELSVICCIRMTACIWRVWIERTCPAWQESGEARKTYEFSKLEYVLPVFVTALQGAICLG